MAAGSRLEAGMVLEVAVGEREEVFGGVGGLERYRVEVMFGSFGVVIVLVVIAGWAVGMLGLLVRELGEESK
jgi:hypothetical protein